MAHGQYLRLSLFRAYSPNFKRESDVQKELFVLVNKRIGVQEKSLFVRSNS
jgi:hypothetical protein